jgi:hypothetical protein
MGRNLSSLSSCTCSLEYDSHNWQERSSLCWTVAQLIAALIFSNRIYVQCNVYKTSLWSKLSVKTSLRRLKPNSSKEIGTLHRRLQTPAKSSLRQTPPQAPPYHRLNILLSESLPSERNFTCSELSSGLYCRVKWLSTDVSEVRTASIITSLRVVRTARTNSQAWEILGISLYQE